MDQAEVVHFVVAFDRPVRCWVTVGKREQAHDTGLGKALLAALTHTQLVHRLDTHELASRTARTITDPTALQDAMERIRQQGYALDDEESNVGIRCIAAPITDESGTTVAAVSISGSKAEFTRSSMPRYVAAVIQADDDVSRRLGSGTLTPSDRRSSGPAPRLDHH